MIKSRKMIKYFLTVSGWTLISRIAGLIRDLMMAAYLGTGVIAEAFQAAFSLPNLFRRFFAEGAFNLAFVPLYTKKLASQKDHEEFASQALSTLAGLLILLTLISQLFMPYFIYAMASGFAGNERFDLAVELSRIIFPYVIFISITALFSGILNSHRHFMAAAAAPVLLNIILILSMVLAAKMNWNIGITLSWGAFLAGISQMGLVYFAVRSLGIKLTLQLPKLTPDIKKLFILAVPAILTGGVVQINLLVGRQVASYFEGAFAWLYYADRLYQLPLGVVGIAIGIVLLPELSRTLINKNINEGQNAFNRALEFSLLLTIPSAIALIIIPVSLISVLFERGMFTKTDSISTAHALAIYGLGLPAFVLQKVLQPLYFAREDTKSPFRFAIFAMILNVSLAIILSFYFGFLSAAIGTTVSSWAMIFLLWSGCRGMGQATKIDFRLKKNLPLIITSSILMGIIIYLVQLILINNLNAPNIRYFSLFILIFSGIISYIFFINLFGVISKKDIRKFIKK
ncbi:murein biosynthesis integral membrane protein MurJ [Amylibacter sp.]|nr:murein biosynthesis integral membrane protein MurJ [Amylibacter sp.]MDB4188212.1 murein biosynthesis integral membrane protein MurJ [bacterium]MDC1247592.1 murein biosynthesis integral membrane protein MurJ [Amylibacter sp.]